jgi:hypothetical protein
MKPIPHMYLLAGLIALKVMGPATAELTRQPAGGMSAQTVSLKSDRRCYP